jgi:hypothetical protein
VTAEERAERLAMIASRHRSTTRGKWVVDHLRRGALVRPAHLSSSLLSIHGRGHHETPILSPADAEFMAHAKQDVPWLLHLVGRLIAVNERLRTTANATAAGSGCTIPRITTSPTGGESVMSCAITGLTMDEVAEVLESLHSEADRIQGNAPELAARKRDLAVRIGDAYDQLPAVTARPTGEDDRNG